MASASNLLERGSLAAARRHCTAGPLGFASLRRPLPAGAGGWLKVDAGYLTPRLGIRLLVRGFLWRLNMGTDWMTRLRNCFPNPKGCPLSAAGGPLSAILPERVHACAFDQDRLGRLSRGDRLVFRHMPIPKQQSGTSKAPDHRDEGIFMEQDGIFGDDYSPDVFPTFVGGIVSQIYEWSLSGVPCEEIARRLNGLETGTGNRATNISTILRRGQCKN